MVEVIPFKDDEPPAGDFFVLVEPEPSGGKAVDGDRHGIRLRYGPRSFAGREEAVRTACVWAEQYAVSKVYVH